MADLTGQTFGQYKITGRIGKGGMASVFRARQESMDRDVAIKVMAAELANNEEFTARFEREARVIARLQHPHIIPVIDFGRSGDFVYLVMRLVEGGTLSDRLLEGSLTIQQVNIFLSQIGSALEYAHQRGVVHRDLKPNNVLLDDADNTYLTDFGIAKMISAVTGSQKLTSTGAVMGTPAYMAPEQWRSEPVDARTDIYALGIILYEMLIGGLPFHADTPFGMMYKHFDAPPPPLRVINPNLPEPVERIVLRALAKNPIDRYSSARQLADDFSRTMITLPPDTLVEELPRATAQQIASATAVNPRAPSSGYQPPRVPPTIPPTSAGMQPDGTYIGPAGVYSAPGTVVMRSKPFFKRPVGWGVMGALLLVAVVVGALLLLNGGSDKNKGGKNTPVALAAVGTETPDAGTSEALTPTITNTASAIIIVTTAPEGTEVATEEIPVQTEVATEVQTEVVTEQPTETPIPTEAPTETPIPTETETPKPSSTPAPSRTPLNIRATVQAQRTAQSATQAALGDSYTQTAIAAESMFQTAAAAEQMTGTAAAGITQTAVAAESDNLTQTAAVGIQLTQTAEVSIKLTDIAAQAPTLPPPPSRTPSITPIPTLPATPTMVASPTVSNECGGMQSRLKPNEGARTTLYPNTPTRVHQAASMTSPEMKAIPAGQTFWLLDGPQCVDNVWFWHIEVVDASGQWNGYIGEGAAGSYWIEPFDTGPVECPGAPSPRLTPGQQARVTLYPAVPSRVRSQPNTSGALQTQLQPGAVFTVTSGPVCDSTNHYRWWLITTSTNISGWIAEGKTGEYWIEPWQQ